MVNPWSTKTNSLSHTVGGGQRRGWMPMSEPTTWATYLLMVVTWTSYKWQGRLHPVLEVSSCSQLMAFTVFVCSTPLVSHFLKTNTLWCLPQRIGLMPTPNPPRTYRGPTGNTMRLIICNWKSYRHIRHPMAIHMIILVGYPGPLFHHQVWISFQQLNMLTIYAIYVFSTCGSLVTMMGTPRIPHGYPIIAPRMAMCRPTRLRWSLWHFDEALLAEQRTRPNHTQPIGKPHET